jgi:hypothetical protein
VYWLKNQPSTGFFSMVLWSEACESGGGCVSYVNQTQDTFVKGAT